MQQLKFEDWYKRAPQILQERYPLGEYFKDWIETYKYFYKHGINLLERGYYPVKQPAID